MRLTIWLIVKTAIICAVLFYLAGQSVFDIKESEFLEERQMIELDAAEVNVERDLRKDDYFVKIKYVRPLLLKSVAVNGKSDGLVELEKKRKGVVNNEGFYVPKGLIREGKNTLTFSFNEKSDFKADVFLSNYRKKIGSGIYIVFNEDRKPIRESERENSFVFIIAYYLGLSVFAWLIWKYFFTVAHRPIMKQFTSLSIPFFMLLFLWVNNLFNFYRIYFTQSCFFAFAFFTAAGWSIFINFEKLKYVFSFPRKRQYSFKIELPVRVRFFRVSFEHIFILLFFITLFLSSIFIILGMKEIAEEFAKLATIFLAAGICIKTSMFFKSEGPR
ncbi:MAG: hypothetical protein AB1530_03265 [Candidatus Omnitrophota bacterium]